MIHLFFNALAASAGAGLTYVRNIVPEISRRAELRATIAIAPALRAEFPQGIPNVSFVELDAWAAGVRFWREQTALPALLRRTGADVLISTGNFALRKSPVPQILLSGNSLYTSADFYHDLLARRDYSAWLDTHLKAAVARYSIHWADLTVSPSQSFANILREWTGCEVISVYHGFNRELFFQDSSPLPTDLAEKIGSAGDAIKLLFVSHYNYYRNFETLLRAVPLIREHAPAGRVRLFLTCEFDSAKNPGTYRAESAANLVKQLQIADEVVQLGSVPYGSLHQLYRACDIYVTPAYAETFAHPLVEAMASGLPIVASDIPVHREICGQSAVFFDCFSPRGLAAQVLGVASAPGLVKNLQCEGRERSRAFSWREHLDQIVKLAEKLLADRS